MTRRDAAAEQAAKELTRKRVATVASLSATEIAELKVSAGKSKVMMTLAYVTSTKQAT